MEKVLANKSLKQYRGWFRDKPKEKISLSNKCPTVMPPDITLTYSTCINIIEEIPTDSNIPAAN